MARDPHLNAGLKWRLLGAFVVAALTPVALIFFRAPQWAAIVASLVVAGFLAWYVGRYILGNVNRLLSIAERLGRFRRRRSGAYSRDELGELIHDFDHFLNGLEHSYTEGLEPPSDAEPAEPGLLRAAHGRAVFQASLATGDTLAGDATVLPGQATDYQRSCPRMTGVNAVRVFRETLTVVKEQLAQLRDVPELDEKDKGIIEFQRLLLEDEALIKGVETCLGDKLNLNESISTTFAIIISKLVASKNAYIAARADDCLDLKQRLMDAIIRKVNPGVQDLYADAAGKVVFCQQIYPSEVIMLQRAGAVGIVSALGTASSHAEILLRSFNIPSLVNIEGLPVHMLKGRKVLLDTLHKRLIIDPTPDEVTELTHQARVDPKLIIREPVQLQNGEAVAVCATINNVTVEARRARETGADGVGLFRSEMSFIGRPNLPGEEELFQEYKTLVGAFKGMPISMRMLDLGSDKIASFGQDEGEENPCMGNRSMRLLIRRSDIFRNQLRAMIRAASDETCILFPMISGWHELDRISQFIKRVADELEHEEIEGADRVKYGLMVEVPGVVERFQDYVGEFDEFNIGTNDLTQYTLAADRNNRNVTEYFKTYHPSILSMIERICRLGAGARKKVCLCGEMANEIELLPLLIGLGVRRYSVPYLFIPQLKQLVRSVDVAKCRELAGKALASRSTDQVEALLREYRFLAHEPYVPDSAPECPAGT